MGAAVVAIVVRKQKEIVQVFQGARATSPERARDPDELGIDRGHIFDGLIRRAVLRPAGDGRYYVDEPSWRALHDRRRFVAVVTLIALAAVVVAVVLAVGSRV